MKVLKVKLNTNRRTPLKKLPYLSSDLNLNYNELASRFFSNYYYSHVFEVCWG